MLELKLQVVGTALVTVTCTRHMEKTISRDFPFTDLHTEAAGQHVVRTYLQFLWLPDSIMPVRLLIPALLRATPAAALFEPLLLSPRSAANKYHVELPQILADGGGAGEVEESMMWFALNYEKHDGDEGPWEDGAWRQRWLARLERREVQIQILLHLLVLSLVAEHTPDLPSPRPKKRKRDTPAPPSVEERLESFMDKLSMWQLVQQLDSDRHSTHAGGTANGRDWMQAFCEDIVEQHFISKLPDACALLRTKVFPNSPFSDDDTSLGPSRSASPDQAPSRASPSLSSTSGIPLTLTKPPEISSAPFRSRSLSVTLALDADARKAGSTGTAGAGAKKRVLNREVSMSRVFKGKVQEKRVADTKRVSGKEAGGSRGGKISRVDNGKTLVAATPMKARTGSRVSQGSTSRMEEEEIWDMALL